ncbi:MAG: adenylate kinase family protein [Thermoproteus sp.]
MRVLITGTPGVGKTTSCRELSGLLGVRCIEVAALLAGRPFTKWDPYSLTYDILDVEAARRALEEEMAGDYIVDTHVLDLIGGDVDYVFVLRKRPDVLFKELKGRGWPLHKVVDNVWSEILDYIYLQAREKWGRIYQIDVTEKSTGQTVDAMVKCIRGVACPDDEVDWLQYSLETGLLDKLEAIANRASSRPSSSPRGT